MGRRIQDEISTQYGWVKGLGRFSGIQIFHAKDDELHMVVLGLGVSLFILDMAEGVTLFNQ